MAAADSAVAMASAVVAPDVAGANSVVIGRPSDSDIFVFVENRLRALSRLILTEGFVPT